MGTALRSASYLASGPADVHLGLGDADASDLPAPGVNQHIELRRGDGEPVAAP